MANVETRNVGDRATPQWTWEVNDVPTDPTQIIIRQQTPAGVESIVTTAATPSALTPSSTPLARVSVGVFKLNPGVSLNASGYWLFRGEATGVAESAAPDFVYKTLPSEFTADAGLDLSALVGLQEAKDWLQQRNIETGDELELASVINDVSRLFQEEADREFKPAAANPQTRSFSVIPSGPSEPWYVDGVYLGERSLLARTVYVGDLASFTQVQIISDADWTTVLETVPLASVTGHPMVRNPWEPIRYLELQTDTMALRAGMRVAVQGTWGFPSVPGDVRRAVLKAVAAEMDRDVEHYRQDYGTPAPEEAGTTIMIGQGSQRMLSLPPSVLAVAWRYRDPVLG
jgi:hypothetical protein